MTHHQTQSLHEYQISYNIVWLLIRILISFYENGCIEEVDCGLVTDTRVHSDSSHLPAYFLLVYRCRHPRGGVRGVCATTIFLAEFVNIYSVGVLRMKHQVPRLAEDFFTLTALEVNLLSL